MLILFINKFYPSPKKNIHRNSFFSFLESFKHYLKMVQNELKQERQKSYHANMKNLIIKILILLILFTVVNSLLIEDCRCQWVQQYTGTTANLSSIKFINKNTGWACGEGVMLKTTNSGTNWTILTLPVNKPLQRLFPVDTNIVYCVGAFETIIKSTNGGTNWQVIRDGVVPENSYFCCYFLNQNTGWITGGSTRKILKTTNGCTSFDSIVTTTSGFIYDIHFRDPFNGLYCDDNGAVRKTTNGGYNWFTINIPVGTYYYFFRNFSFINSQTGWLVNDSRKVFKTTDYGSNWDSISNIPNGSYGIHNIFFSSTNTGWAGGEGYGSMFKSTDGGVSWREEYIPNPSGGTHSICFINDSIGWKIGNQGRIYHTETSGQPLNIFSNSSEIINDFELHQNFPNPFNSSTRISFDILKSGLYQLEIFNITGEKIETLVNKYYSQGKYEIIYKANNLSSGIYFYKLSNRESSLIKKLSLIK